MQIYIQTTEGKVLQLKVQPTDTVEHIKKLIQSKEGVQINKQKLTLNGVQLQNHRGISYYGILEDAKLQLTFKLIGGQINTFKFNNLQNETTGRFSSNAPEWRYICKGLNLTGICQGKCIANGQEVWINKGFGRFNMSRQVRRSQCPICHSICKNVSNMGIYLAKCQVEGMIMGSDKEVKKTYEHKNPSDFLTFKDQNDNEVEWEYLQFHVKEL